MHWLPWSTQSVCRRAQPCLPTELRYLAVSVSAPWVLNTVSQEYVTDTINYMFYHVLFFYRQGDWERTTDLKEMFGVLNNHLSIFPPGNHKRVLYLGDQRAPLPLSYFPGVCVEEAQSSLVTFLRFLPTLIFPSGAPCLQGCQLPQGIPPSSRIQRWSSETGSPCSVTPTPHDIRSMESNILSKSR